MKTSLPSENPRSLVKTTTVFTSGNSQAVRLPKEFRFNTKTVEISRRGDEIILRERPQTLADALANLPALNGEEAKQFDDAMKQVKINQLTIEERNFSWEAEPVKKLATRKTKIVSNSPKASSPSKRRA